MKRLKNAALIGAVLTTLLFLYLSFKPLCLVSTVSFYPNISTQLGMKARGYEEYKDYVPDHPPYVTSYCCKSRITGKRYGDDCFFLEDIFDNPEKEVERAAFKLEGEIIATDKNPCKFTPICEVFDTIDPYRGDSPLVISIANSFLILTVLAFFLSYLVSFLVKQYRKLKEH